MRNPLVLALSFIFAAAQSVTLGDQSPSRHGNRPTMPAEMEHELLTITAFCLFGWLVMLNLIIRFPDLGAVIAAYNQF
jgi:hypothetical protein